MRQCPQIPRRCWCAFLILFQWQDVGHDHVLVEAGPCLIPKFSFANDTFFLCPTVLCKCESPSRRIWNRICYSETVIIICRSLSSYGSLRALKRSSKVAHKRSGLTVLVSSSVFVDFGCNLVKRLWENFQICWLLSCIFLEFLSRNFFWRLFFQLLFVSLTSGCFYAAFLSLLLLSSPFCALLKFGCFHV